jgi:hypothetical protein
MLRPKGFNVVSVARRRPPAASANRKSVATWVNERSAAAAFLIRATVL